VVSTLVRDLFSKVQILVPVWGYLYLSRWKKIPSPRISKKKRSGRPQEIIITEVGNGVNFNN
jgi:hypothetical protein